MTPDLPRLGVVRRLDPVTDELTVSYAMPLRAAAELAALEAHRQPRYIWDVWPVPPWPGT